MTTKLNFRTAATIGTAEFAELLDCSSMTILRWAKAGKIPAPAYHVGRRLRWDLRTVEDWLVESDFEMVWTGDRPLPVADPESKLGALAEEAQSLTNLAEELLARTMKIETQVKLLNREQHALKNRKE